MGRETVMIKDFRAHIFRFICLGLILLVLLPAFSGQVRAQSLPSDNTQQSSTGQQEKPQGDEADKKEEKKDEGEISTDEEKRACQVAEMKKRYQSSCFSCLVVRELLKSFLEASTKVYTLCRDAGVQILLIGTILWVAFFVLKQVSSLSNIEPASLVNTLLQQFFKILVAYVVIVSGANTFINYVVNPLLDAGADFGIGILDSSAGTLSVEPSSKYTYEGNSVLSGNVLNKILAFNEQVDRVTSTNLVIGHALTCHSVHAGAWAHVDIWIATVVLPNIWIWLCGAAIWFAGFMLTLAISYYLLDISFKIGISIIIFPIVMGLWPFAPTQNKVFLCIQTILRSAALFGFLAIATSYAMTLISESLRDINTLYDKINAGDAAWISETFEITGPYFIIIIFCYLYAIKLVGSVVTDYLNKFFSGGLSSGSSPMHSELTRVTDMAKHVTVGAAFGVAGYAWDISAHQGGRALKGTGKGIAKGSKAAVNWVKKYFKKKDDKSDKKDDKSDNQSGSNKPNAGTAVKQAGKATEASGKAIEASGKAMEQGGKAAEAGGKATAQGGQAAMKGGNAMIAKGGALCGTGIGALIGIPLILAGAVVTAGGAAVYATGKAVEYSGKAMQYAGKAVKAAGKAVKKVGQNMKRTGKVMEKTLNKVSNALDKIGDTFNSWGNKARNQGNRFMNYGRRMIYGDRQNNQQNPNGNGQGNDSGNNGGQQ